MDAESRLAVDLPVDSIREETRVTARARAVGLIGPLTVMAGIVWAILQPYRITLLHPHGESLWFLFVQPPLLVVLAGIAFAALVARPLVADIEDAEREGPV